MARAPQGLGRTEDEYLAFFFRKNKPVCVQVRAGQNKTPGSILIRVFCLAGLSFRVRINARIV